MRKLVFAIIMAILVFSTLNFVYCNLDAGTFGYPVSFKFSVPYLMAWRTIPLPMGFILMIVFCLGMIAIAVLEAIPSLYKSLELRTKNKKIRELERELTVARQVAGVEKNGRSSP